MFVTSLLPQNNSGNATSIMPLWLKSFNTVNTGTGIHYTVQQINHYVMPIQGELIAFPLQNDPSVLLFVSTLLTPLDSRLHRDRLVLRLDQRQHTTRTPMGVARCDDDPECRRLLDVGQHPALQAHHRPLCPIL